MEASTLTYALAILVSEFALQGDSNKIASGATVRPLWGGGRGV